MSGPPLRIAVNARLLVAQEYSGVHLYVYQALCELLRQRPQDEFLFICDRSGELPDFPRPVERITCSPPARHPLLYIAWLEWSVPRALRKWRADVFVCLDNFCSLRTEVLTVLAVHDLAYQHFPEGIGGLDRLYYRHFMPKFCRKAAALVAVSQATRRDIAESYGLDEAGILVAPNGVRPRFQPLSAGEVEQVREQLTQGQPYIVAVGSVHPRKNIDGLIRAFGKFCESGQPHHLVLVGRMAWRTTAVEEALLASPVRERIHVTGYVDDARLGQLIGAAQQLALVSHWEGFGVPIIEALACGVPVVVSQTSSLPEVAGPGGVAVNSQDNSAIASAMLALANDADLRESLAAAGQAHIQQYTWAACAKTLGAAIDAVRVTQHHILR